MRMRLKNKKIWVPDYLLYTFFLPRIMCLIVVGLNFFIIFFFYFAISSLETFSTSCSFSPLARNFKPYMYFTDAFLYQLAQSFIVTFFKCGDPNVFRPFRNWFHLILGLYVLTHLRMCS